MKRLLIILPLLLPTLLIAQQDSIKRVFKIGNPLTFLCEQRNDSISLSCFEQCIHSAIICGKSSDSIAISSPHKIGQLTVRGIPYYTIVGFTMSITYGFVPNTGPTYSSAATAPAIGSPKPMVSGDADLTMDMIRAIEFSSPGTIIKFYNIQCMLPDRTIQTVTDLILYIKGEPKQPDKIGNPVAEILAGCGGSVSKDSLIKAGKIVIEGTKIDANNITTISGILDKYKVLGFSLTVGHYYTQSELAAKPIQSSNGYAIASTTNTAPAMISNDGNLTQQMISAIANSHYNDVMMFGDIQCSLPDGKTIVLPGFSLYMNGK